MERKKIKPRIDGNIIRNPYRNMAIIKSGDEVIWGSYWVRREKAGDIEVIKEVKEEAKQEEKKKKQIKKKKK